MQNEKHLPPDFGRQLDTLELAALSYLGLPVVVFILGWLRPTYATIGAGLFLFSWFGVLRHRRRIEHPIHPWKILAVAAVAALWVSLSGLVGDFHLNSDWRVRMSVLRDLTVGEWPVGYGPMNGQELILRFPMGYYMVPALIGKVTGLSGAYSALWAWTVLGTGLFLLLVGNAAGRLSRSWLIPVAVAIWFSGMDIIGWLLFRGQLPSAGQHIEWWAGLFQYSSQTTVLFWVPNHAIPGWLAALIVWRHRDTGLAMAPAALLLLCVAFWAPLVAIGAAPLVVLCAVRGQPWQSVLRESFQVPVLATLPVGLAFARFITFGVPTSAVSATAQAGLSIAPLLELLSIFSVLEWGLLAALISASGQRSWLFWAAVIELLGLPALRFGPGNDIVMRGGIPALTIIMLFATTAFTTSRTPKDLRIAIAVVLLVGCATPLLEFQRAFTASPRYHNETQNFIELNGTPWHYVGTLNQPSLQRIIRNPVPLPSGSTIDR